MLLMSVLLALVVATPAPAADQTPPESVARDWFVALLKGDRETVKKLTRTPFAAGGILIPNEMLMEEHVFAAIGSSRQKKVDVPPEALKATKLERFKPETEMQRRALEQVYAKRFIQVKAGEATWIIYLTHGPKPKVVGVVGQ
jgi:hypothetical protein